jgi:tetratricopeptide (TPR) repeat protein
MNVGATFAVQAQELLEQGNPAEAIALCRQGLSEYPHYVTAYLILARAFIAVGDYASAEQALERGTQQSPRSATARALRKEVRYALRLKEQSKTQAATTPVALQNALTEASEAATYIDRGETLPQEQAEKTLGTYLRIIETDRTRDEQASSYRSNNLRLIPGLDFTPLRVESSGERNANGARGANVPEPPPLAEFADWQQYQESLRNERIAGIVSPAEQDDAKNFDMLKPQTGYSRPPLPTPRFSVSEIENLPLAGEARRQEGLSEIDALASKLMQARMPEAQELLAREADMPEYLRQNSGEVVSDALPRAGTVIISETMAKIYEAQGALAQALHAYKTLAEEATEQNNAEKLSFFSDKVQRIAARIAAQPPHHHV